MATLAMNFGRPALHMGVVPSLAMLSGGQRSIGACTKPGDAPLTSQRLTGGSCQARRCLSCGPVLDRGLCQARRCPSGGPALDRGSQQARNAPLVGQCSTGGIQAAAPMAAKGGDGGGLTGPSAVRPLRLANQPHTEWRLALRNIQPNFCTEESSRAFSLFGMLPTDIIALWSQPL